MAVAFAAALAVTSIRPCGVVPPKSRRWRQAPPRFTRKTTRCAFPAQADAALSLHTSRLPKKKIVVTQKSHRDTSSNCVDSATGADTSRSNKSNQTHSAKLKSESAKNETTKPTVDPDLDKASADAKPHRKEHLIGKSADTDANVSRKDIKKHAKLDAVAPSKAITGSINVSDQAEEPEFLLSDDVSGAPTVSPSTATYDSKSGSVLDMTKQQKQSSQLSDPAQSAGATDKKNSSERKAKSASSSTSAGNSFLGEARKRETSTGSSLTQKQAAPQKSSAYSSSGKLPSVVADPIASQVTKSQGDAPSESLSARSLQQSAQDVQNSTAETSTKLEAESSQQRKRILSIERIRHLGGATKREVNRLFTESSITSSLRMPTQREFTLFAWETLLVVALVALLRTGVSRTLRWIHNRLDSTRRSTKGSFPYEQSVFECMQRPLEVVSIFTVGTAMGEVVSRPLAATGLLRYLRTLRELGVILAATWFLLRWIDRIRTRFSVDKRMDKAQIDATSRVVSVITIAISLLISLDTLGVNIQKVLAFGGIGGVAIGFAGREIISNFFGGFMIFLTRPFSVGEWIRSIEEAELNGTVEDIGWYLTRIRTWDKRPLYIPNSRFSTLIVENPSRMTNRRICHTLHVRIEDMPVVTKVVHGVDQYLKKHPELDPKQHRLAYIDSFDEFSVKIWLSCYTKSVFLFDFRRVQQEILIAAYSILREHGARLATVTTRDVRPGADPDRYGALGVSSLRHRHATTPTTPPSVVAPGVVSRPGEDHFEGFHGSSIAADIESGLRQEEIMGQINISPAPSTSAAGSSSGSHSKPVPASSGIAGSGSSKGNTGAAGSVSAPDHAGSAVKAGQSKAKIVAENSASFGRQNTSPTAAEALEMAAAAIIAARQSQSRMNQNEVSGDGSAGHRGSPRNGQPASVASQSHHGSQASASQSGAPGGQTRSASGQAEETPSSGQMRISAAPPHGSTTTTPTVFPATTSSPKDDSTLAERQEKAGASPSSTAPRAGDTEKNANEPGKASGNAPSTGTGVPSTSTGQMNITAARPKQKPLSPKAATHNAPSPARDAQRSSSADLKKGAAPGPVDDSPKNVMTAKNQSSSTTSGLGDAGKDAELEDRSNDDRN